MRSLASPPYTRVETGDLIVTQEHVYKFFAQFECVPLPTHWKSHLLLIAFRHACRLLPLVFAGNAAHGLRNEMT